MLLSDSIAKLIEELLEEGGGSAELKRSELASRFGCVPSQVTYVITSRFTPERGYITESRRGGGGYIRIERVPMGANEYLMHFFHAVGDSVDEREAAAYLTNLRDNGIISDREGALVLSSLSDGALANVPRHVRDSIRADILRHVILTLLR